MKRTENLYSLNSGIADAAHIAFAETSADYFITCDDKLLKKVHKLKGINMEVVNPVNFCTKENLR
jgi:predicted nucleic acid-binding protein